MTPVGPSEQATSAGKPTAKTFKFSRKRLALAFAIAGISDAIGAFVTLMPPVVWLVDLGTALLLFHGAGPAMAAVAGTSLESIPGGYFHSGCWWLGRLPSWALLGRILNCTDEVSSGSLADMASALPNVRFTPKSQNRRHVR
jgi:hypothetical protein